MVAGGSHHAVTMRNVFCGIIHRQKQQMVLIAFTAATSFTAKCLHPKIIVRWSRALVSRFASFIKDASRIVILWD
jgi:hypothetical protein